MSKRPRSPNPPGPSAPSQPQPPIQPSMVRNPGGYYPPSLSISRLGRLPDPLARPGRPPLRPWPGLPAAAPAGPPAAPPVALGAEELGEELPSPPKAPRVNPAPRARARQVAPARATADHPIPDANPPSAIPAAEGPQVPTSQDRITAILASGRTLRENVYTLLRSVPELTRLERVFAEGGLARLLNTFRKDKEYSIGTIARYATQLERLVRQNVFTPEGLLGVLSYSTGEQFINITKALAESCTGLTAITQAGVPGEFISDIIGQSGGTIASQRVRALAANSQNIIDLFSISRGPDPDGDSRRLRALAGAFGLESAAFIPIAAIARIAGSRPAPGPVK